LNIVDYIIAGILFVSAVHGWYIGFVLSFFNIAGYIIAGFTAKFYYKTAAIWISQLTQIDENIKQFIDESMAKSLSNTGLDTLQNGSEGISKLPSQELNQMVENLPTTLQVPLLDNLNNFSSQVSEFVLNLLGMISVFIVVLIAIKILVVILNTIAKMPGLKEINRGGGLILGLVKGVFVILISFAVLTLFMGGNPDHIITQYVLDSTMGLWIYQHNILIWLIKPDLFTKFIQ